MTNAKDALKEIIMNYENQIKDATTFSQLNDIVSHMLGSSTVLIALGYLEEAQELNYMCSNAFDVMRTL